MIYRPLRPRPNRRRGVILMVVLILLTLFAIVGITFVFFSQAQATSSRFWKETDFDHYRAGQTVIAPGAGGGSLNPPGSSEGPAASRWAMSQLLFGVADDSGGVNSALRGHELARTMYGFNDTTLNTQPYSGTGRWHFTVSGTLLNGQDDYSLPNYMYFQTDGFVRDPERYGSGGGVTLNMRGGPAAARQPFTGGFNVSYTYPEIHNMFVAAVRADGTVMVPSFHRPWLFNPGLAFNDRTTGGANNDWIIPSGKYKTLRPRPVDMGPGFPYPVDQYGDVKNKQNSPNNNMDSIWMDLDHPVMTNTEDGRRYKPLFAFLIEPLDNRLDVNAHGNLMGPGGTSSISHQGWGRWEVNPAYVLNADANEWRNLLLGNPTTAGRYGSTDGKPSRVPSSAGLNPTPRVFSQLDLNGTNEATGMATDRYDLQGENGHANTAVFPNFSGKGFDNASATEKLQHALLYDYFKPAGWAVSTPGNPPTGPYCDDTSLNSYTDLRRLLLGGYLNSQVSLTRLARLCPQNFNDASTTSVPLNAAQLAANARRRNMVTPLSVDINRAAIAPWLYDRSGYMVAGPSPVPAGVQTPLPDLSQRNTNIPAATLPGYYPSDFSTADWRSVIAPLEKVDLNQKLQPYPYLGKGTATDRQALDDRQAFAKQIFERLVAVTGAKQPANTATPLDAELEPLRWLAQLAVNIVDYIDEDDVSTAFNFYPHAKIEDGTTNPKTMELLPKYWVFGTEMPTVVLSEVLAEYELPAIDPMTGNPGTGKYKVNVFAELYNPLPPAVPASVQQQDKNPVPLHVPAAGAMPAFNPYRIVVGNSAMGGPLDPNKANVVGGVAEARSVADFSAATTGTVGNPAPTVPMAVEPQKYFLVGPKATDANNTIVAPRVDAATPMHVNPGMQYEVDYNAMGPVHTPDDTGANGVVVTLRRLANPHMPLDENPLSPAYNPFVTVDYLEKVPLRRHVDNTDKYTSIGKRQPFTADPSQVADQVSMTGGVADAIQHTFGKANDPSAGTGKNEWLQHLDRMLVSPVELLNVSGFRPHELTHQFFTMAGAQKHRIPWFDEDLTTSMPPAGHRLWRFLELAETSSLGTGVSRLGRVPGKININMLWEPEILLALCDPQKANYFTVNDIYNPGFSGNPLDPLAPGPIYNRLLASRTPNGIPSANDKPFTSLGVGDRPVTDPQGQMNINNTLLRAINGGDGTMPRLFEQTTEAHPARRYDLLNKIFNHVTTRSNVFAIYLTIGYFEVTDETTRPVKLGKEIDTAGGRVRHQFFSIVDRTQLALDLKKVDGTDLRSSSSSAVPAWVPGAYPAGNPEVVTIPMANDPMGNPIPGSALSGFYRYDAVGPDVTPAQRDIPWNITKGSILIVDDGADQETVEVLAVNPGTGQFQAIFKRWHMPGFRIRMPGNPGPQANFDFFDVKYRNVVLHTHGPYQVP